MTGPDSPGHRSAPYVGLVPSAYSSGNSRVQGSITKAGSTDVRRLLIESAWHHRKSHSTSGPTMRARWDKVEPALRARGHAGNGRLNKRWRSFTERGKNPLVANVAIARELAGWC
jgi:transposase